METDPEKTQLVVTGHSFGGLVIYEALSQSPKDQPSYDAFGDMARHLKSKERPNGVLQT